MNKVCSKCNGTKPLTEFHADKGKSDGLHSICKVCAAEYGRRWRAENAERLAEKKRDYAAANSQNLREYHRNYYLANQDMIRARTRRWYANNKDHASAYHRVYSPAWRAANKEKSRTIVRRRRAIKLGAPGSHTAEDIKRQYKAQHGQCYYCGDKVGDKYHADHVIPLSRGGSDGAENIVIACPSCNQAKNSKLPHEWPQGNRLL